MPTVQDIRKKYPQYSDLSDGQLLDGFHKKFYSDMPINEFYGKFNYVPVTQQAAEVAPVVIPEPAQVAPTPSAQPVAAIPTQAPAPTPTPQGGFIDDITRQIGLTARHGIEGVSEMAGVLTNPIAYGLSKATGRDIPYAGETGEAFADYLGLPVPEGMTEEVVGKASKLATGVGGLAGASGLLGRGAAGAAKGTLGILGARPGAQMAAAAGGGGAGEYVKQSGGGQAAQMTGAILGSVGAGSGAALAGNLAAKANAVIQSARGARRTAEQVLSETLKGSGVKIGDIPVQMRKQMHKEINQAMKIGGEIDEAAIGRIADYAKVGARPTKGTITLDPVAITRERNLSKLAANTGDEGLLAMPRLQRENEMVLMRNLDDLGASQAVGPLATGEAMKRGLLAADQPRKAAVDVAYKNVRDASGRYADLNVPQFANRANQYLDEGALGFVLPKEARKILNSVAEGKTPLNVNTATQIDETLSGLQRDAGMRSKAALAIGKVRDALRETEISTEAGQDAMGMYRTAQGMARDRFKAIGRSPALAAALDDADPDKFVQNYIIGQGKDASVKSVRALASDLKKSPADFDIARNQVLGHLKNKALSGRPDEVASFSPSAYNKELDKLVDKLPSFFDADEISMLKSIGRVAFYEKYLPTGSAVNTSNTAAAFTNVLQKIAGSGLIGKIPFGQQLAAEPARNWANQRILKQAMQPQGILTSGARQPGRGLLVPPVAAPLFIEGNNQ